MAPDAPTKEAVETMMNRSPYSSSNVAALEAYVNAEVTGQQPYFSRANRMLLKQYKTTGTGVNNGGVISKVMLLAMLQFPSTDFMSFLYLIPDAVRKTSPCSNITKCHQLLTACNFADFWKELAAVKDAMEDNDSKNLIDSSMGPIQCEILAAFALCYRNVPLATALEILGDGVASAEDITELSAPSVESVSADSVTFAASGNNTKRNRTYQEGIGFSSIASMMAKIRTE
mmetsp:Transcript_9449/g.25644  ORF Transcript_9449/g.25644 Transcript_9449/m.25644 type:complete len:230 (-) Transcript_9449:472-1161(-)